MKIKRVEDLVDLVSNESGRRKRELAWVRQRLPPAAREPDDAILRMAPVMAYAHWEGFIKAAATGYVHFVARKSLALSRLTGNFQAIVCRSDLIIAAAATKRIRPHLEVVAKLTDGVAASVAVPTNGVIDTESNLTWDVFENICMTIGIDTSTWSPFKGQIDDLFVSRCEVAHGGLVVPEHSVCVQQVTFVLGAIDRFSADITNAACTDRHLRVP